METTTRMIGALLLLLGGCDEPGKGQGAADSGSAGSGGGWTGTDAPCEVLLYWDADGDGYGTDTETRDDCVQEDGWVWLEGDCDDADAAISPGADEICDDRDNDCDDLIDDDDPGVDASAGGVPRYVDGDGDGYGAGAASLACLTPEPGSGMVDNSADCNDTHPDIHPGAVEACNGLDDDCDAATAEDGVATFTRTSGERRNITSDLRGTLDDPAWLSLVEDGTLALCAGTWYARLDLRADITVSGLAGSDRTVLDGGGAGSVISVEEDGVDVFIEGLTLTGGEGSGSSATSKVSGGGGGLYCAGHEIALSGAGLVVRKNHARAGGGILLDGCTGTLKDLTLKDNAAADDGGGLAVLGGAFTLESVWIEDNRAGGGGGGVLVASSSGPASLALVDSLIYDNLAARGSGAEIIDAQLSCTGSTAAWAGVVGNTTSSSEEGAIRLTDYSRSAAFVATACDLGTDSGGDNNASHDFSHTTRDYGDDVTMTCTSGGCTP